MPEPKIVDVRQLRDWSADQREREAWKDGDRATYKFRADLLDKAVATIDALAEALRKSNDVLMRVGDGTGRHGGLVSQAFHRNRALLARLGLEE